MAHDGVWLGVDVMVSWIDRSASAAVTHDAALLSLTDDRRRLAELAGMDAATDRLDRLITPPRSHFTQGSSGASRGGLASVRSGPRRGGRVVVGYRSARQRRQRQQQQHSPASEGAGSDDRRTHATGRRPAPARPRGRRRPPAAPGSVEFEAGGLDDGGGGDQNTWAGARAQDGAPDAGPGGGRAPRGPALPEPRHHADRVHARGAPAGGGGAAGPRRAGARQALAARGAGGIGGGRGRGRGRGGSKLQRAAAGAGGGGARRGGGQRRAAAPSVADWRRGPAGGRQVHVHRGTGEAPAGRQGPGACVCVPTSLSHANWTRWTRRRLRHVAHPVSTPIPLPPSPPPKKPSAWR